MFWKRSKYEPIQILYFQFAPLKFLEYKTRSVCLTLLEALWKERRCNASGAKHQALGGIFKSKITHAYVVENLSVFKNPANGCQNSYECTRIIHSGPTICFYLSPFLIYSSRILSSPPAASPTLHPTIFQRCWCTLSLLPTLQDQ